MNSSVCSSVVRTEATERKFTANLVPRAFSLAWGQASKPGKRFWERSWFTAGNSFDSDVQTLLLICVHSDQDLVCTQVDDLRFPHFVACERRRISGCRLWQPEIRLRSQATHFATLPDNNCRNSRALIGAVISLSISRQTHTWHNFIIYVMRNFVIILSKWSAYPLGCRLVDPHNKSNVV